MGDAKEQRIAQLEQELAAAVGLRRRLVEVATALTSTLKLDDLLGLILEAATGLLDAETSSLMLVDDDTGELVIKIATGAVGPDAIGQRVPASQGIAGWCLAHREPVVLSDPSSDPRFFGEVAVDFESRDLLAVPLHVKEKAIGVVEVLNKKHGATFDDDDVEIAGALANLAAVAIDNAALYARMADAVVTARMSYRL